MTSDMVDECNQIKIGRQNRYEHIEKDRYIHTEIDMNEL